jgi:hypothetical protein
MIRRAPDDCPNSNQYLAAMLAPRGRFGQAPLLNAEPEKGRTAALIFRRMR